MAAVQLEMERGVVQYGLDSAEGQAAWPDELEEEVCQEVQQDVGLKQEV